MVVCPRCLVGFLCASAWAFTSPILSVLLILVFSLFFFFSFIGPGRWFCLLCCSSWSSPLLLFYFSYVCVGSVRWLSMAVLLFYFFPHCTCSDCSNVLSVLPFYRLSVLPFCLHYRSTSSFFLFVLPFHLFFLLLSFYSSAYSAFSTDLPVQSATGCFQQRENTFRL